MANSHTLDAELVQKYITGDEKALEKLIYKHQYKIYNFIYCKVKDKELCEDIFQDSFIKIIKTLKSEGYIEQGKFIAWVMQVTNNVIMDYFRINNRMLKKRDTEDFSVFSLMTNQSLSIEDELINSDISSDLKILIEQLPLNQKEVLKMRIYQDLSFKEIAAISGLNINTVLGNMRYAIKRLKKLIKKYKINLTQYNIL